jgi:pilus assembly protein Flp/PilA
LKQIFRKFADDESGATAIEYCLIAAFIALAIIEAVDAIGINLVGKLQQLLGLLG